MATMIEKGRTGRLTAFGMFALASGLFLALILALISQYTLNGQVIEVSRVVNHIAKLLANESDAIRAVELGREAIRKGEWNLGQIYLVNAVTNSPRKLAYLDAYATCVLQGEDAPLDALDRLTSVLQLAAYQVDSGDVPAVLSLIEKAEQARKRPLQGGEKGVPKDQSLDLQSRWDKLAKVDVAIWKDSTKLNSHQKSLEDFVSAIDEQDEPNLELRGKAADELARWSEIAQAVRQCTYIDACLERLRNGEDLTSQRAVAIIQAAENALPTFWGLSRTSLPLDIRSKIDQYPERVQSLVRDIGEARSVSLLKQITETLAGDAEPSQGQKWQDKCEAIEKQLREAQRIATQLTSTDALVKAQNLLEKRSKDLRSCRNNQYYEYQTWVIKKCDAAFKQYNSYRFGLSESDARKVFSDQALSEVDQSLLSPEVSRIFNDVLGKLTVEMGPKALVATEKEMGMTAKKKSEDF